jgi:hypothetical protein
MQTTDLSLLGPRPEAMWLPIDPVQPSAPRIGGTLTYNERNLPLSVSMLLDSAGTLDPNTAMTMDIVSEIQYTRDGLPELVRYADTVNGTRTATVSATEYDIRRRPVHQDTLRQAMPMTTARDLSMVSQVTATTLRWDGVSNLTLVDDRRPYMEWPAGFSPVSSAITHDALYRVADVAMHYSGGGAIGDDSYVDWRSEMNLVKSSDPMRTEPAPRLTATPTNRARSLTYDYDWLANMTSWDDDAAQFYERSIGGITNGFEAGKRPSALYLATNLSTASHAYSNNADRGGYVEPPHIVGSSVALVGS